MMNSCIVLILLALAISPLHAFPAQSLTLSEAVATALKQHPRLKESSEEYAKAVAEEKGAESGFLPHLSFEALGKEGPTSAPSFGFSGLVNSTLLNHDGADVTLNYLLDDFGRTLHKARMLLFAAASAFQNEEGEKNFLILSVGKAYADALFSKELVGFYVRDLSTKSLTEKLAESRFDAGLTSRLDLDLAKVDLAKSKVNLVAAENDYENSVAALNVAMGISISQAYDLQPLPEKVPVPPSLNQSLADAMDKRPEIQGLKMEVESAGEGIKEAQSNGSPVVRLLATGGYLHVLPAEAGENHAYGVGIGISFPFYMGGEVEAGILAARHEEAAQQSALEDLKQEVRLEVNTAWLTLDGLLKNRESVEEELARAKDSGALAYERYRQGLGSILEVREAELSLLNAELDKARLETQTFVARESLDYATGVLTRPESEENKDR